MKILEILVSVNKRDMTRIENVINSNQNHRLKGLHNYLKGLRKPDAYSKEDAYSAVFGKTYSVKNDYLLRNELRHYHNLLREELAQTESDNPEISINYLRYLLRKKLFDPFKIELRKAEKQFSKSEDFKNLNEVYRLQFEYIYRNEFGADKHSIESLHKSLQNRYRVNQLYADTVSRELEVANAFLKLYAIKLGVDAPDNLHPTSDTGIYAEYLSYKKKSFETTGDDKIRNLLKALELIRQVDPVITDIKKETLVIRNNLALEYFFLREYDKALEVYREIFKNESNPKDGSLNVIYYNYISALLKSGRFAEADQLFTSEQVSFEDIPGMKTKFRGLKIMCKVFNSDVGAAKEIIPEKLNEGSDDDYLYVRLCLSIVYFLEGKYDLCERENTNIIQASHEAHSAYSFCANAFNKFLRYTEHKHMRKLQGQVTTFINDTTIRHSDILPLLWLKRQIDSNINIL